MEAIKTEGSSFEILPPMEINGRQSVVGINIHYGKRLISINHKTNTIGETDKEKLRNPEDFKAVTISFDQLKWLAPRLEGMRKHLGIPSGWDESVNVV